MLSSNKMTDDQRINMIRMSNPPTAIALCLQNFKKKKGRFFIVVKTWLPVFIQKIQQWQQPEKQCMVIG